MANYQLGDRVRYAEQIVRRGSRPGEGAPDRLWSNEKWIGHKLPGGEGIIVGKRTLSTGDVDYMGPEDGSRYVQRSSFTAYLVAFDLHRKPVHVLPEHLTAVEA